MFGRVYAKARLGEELPIAVVLKRGYTSQIPKELDALLAKQPRQPFALALYGGYEAGVIRKVGSLVGGITYGVSSDKMELYFDQVQEATTCRSAITSTPTPSPTCTATTSATRP